MVVGVICLTLCQECRRKGKCFGPSNCSSFSVLENKLIGYFTLIAVATSPAIRVAVAESLNRDLGRVSEWCDHWKIKLIGSKTKTIIISRSCTMHPQSPLWPIGWTVLNECDDLDQLGVTFDSKMTFEKHLRSDSRSASQRLGILRKSWRIFHHRSLLWSSYLVFFLPDLECDSAVWCSAAYIHLKLLDRIVSGARFLTAQWYVSVRHCSSSIWGSTVNAVWDQVHTDAHSPRCSTCVICATVLSSHICILKRLITTEPRSIAGPLLSSQCPCGTILLTLYSMVSDRHFFRAGPMFIYWPKLLDPFLPFSVFPFLFFLSIGWFCWAGVF